MFCLLDRGAYSLPQQVARIRKHLANRDLRHFIKIRIQGIQPLADRMLFMKSSMKIDFLKNIVPCNRTAKIRIF